AEVWKDLGVDFESDRVSSDWGCYNCVKVRAAAACYDDFHARLVAWLKERRSEQGREPRKILAAVAKTQFGGAYRVRAFNHAYRDAYGRARGRPPATKKINK